jgi:pimeloyl-ACP methyl ester carboxylesterase
MGSEDIFSSLLGADEMCSLIRDSEFLWLKGVGHMPNREHADLFNATLLRFLERIPAQPVSA